MPPWAGYSPRAFPGGSQVWCFQRAKSMVCFFSPSTSIRAPACISSSLRPESCILLSFSTENRHHHLRGKHTPSWSNHLSLDDDPNLLCSAWIVVAGRYSNLLISDEFIDRSLANAKGPCSFDWQAMIFHQQPWNLTCFTGNPDIPGNEDHSNTRANMACPNAPCYKTVTPQTYMRTSPGSMVSKVLFFSA